MTVRGVDHVGLTVPNLEEAIRFFADALGFSELYRIGPFEAADDWMARRLGVHPRTRIPQIAVLENGSGARLELFEYEAPDQADAIPRNSDIGGHHVAFYADDLPDAIARMQQHGAELMDAPTTMTEGPSAGETWVYLRSPWGLQLELVNREAPA